MKKLLQSVFVLLIISGTQQFAFGYCTPTLSVWNSGITGDYISNVTLGSINNSSGYEYPSNDYIDYSAQVCTLSTCGSNTISITYSQICTAFSPNSNFVNSLVANWYIAAWIDYNNDNILDASEKLDEVAASVFCTSATFSINFNVPNSVVNGLKRLRIMLAYANPGLDPCMMGGSGEVEDYSVFINITTPNISLTSNTPVCSGNNIQLNAGGGTSYSWVGPNGFYSSQQNPPVVGATTANSGNYVVTVTGSNGCTASSSTAVTVSDYPTAFSGSNSPVCAGKPLHLTSGGGSTYLWSGPNGYSSTQQNPTISSAAPVNIGSYTVTVTNSSGCAAVSTLSVNVNNNPVVISGYNDPVCKGSTLQFSATGGTNYSWAGPNGFNASIANPFIQSSAINNTGNYVVTVTNSNGCSSSNTVSVTVHPDPVVNSGTNSPVCEGSNLQLTSGGGSLYSWVGPNGFSSNLANPVISSSAISNSGNYIVTVTDGYGCTSSSTVSAVINSNPVANAGNSSDVCVGDEVQLIGSSGNSYDWTGPNGFISSLQNPVINSISLIDAGQYIFTVTDSNNCNGTDSIIISVNQLPVINSVSNSPVCEGGTIQLNASGGTAYSWSGPGSFSSLQQNPSISSATSGEEGIYVVAGLDSVTGCTSFDSLHLIVNNLPAVSLTLSIDTLCLMAGQLLLNGGLPASGTYSGPGVFGGSFIADSAGLGIHAITYTFTDSNGCSNTASDTVYVDGCTGIEELNSAGYFSLYPNPFNSDLTIENYESTGDLDIELISLDGRKLKSWNLDNSNKYFLQLSDMPSGIYFLVLNAGDQRGFFRVVKQN